MFDYVKNDSNSAAIAGITITNERVGAGILYIYIYINIGYQFSFPTFTVGFSLLIIGTHNLLKN